MDEIRVRFAPSPTGYLHVGNARTALFNYLFARANGGKFILRIEDTDQERSTAEVVDQVLQSLNWMGLEWDEGPGVEGAHGPYYQSERLDIYNKYFDQMLEAGQIYRCFCTGEKLQSKKEACEKAKETYVYDSTCRDLSEDEIQARLAAKTPFTYRLRTPEREIRFKDGVKGEMRFNTDIIGDIILRRTDGFPTYNFAVVIDDALMQISHVIRGDDHISNTPKQILVYLALGFKVPKFFHISMILGANKEKLSKRHGATGVHEFRDEGYLSDPFINHLALLGWSPKDGKEIISREDLKKAFVHRKFSKSPAVFDYGKLDFLNGNFIRNTSIDELFPLIRPIIEAAGLLKSDAEAAEVENLKKIASLAKDYCKKLTEIPTYIKIYLEDDFEIPAELKEWVDSVDSRKLFALSLEQLEKGSGDYVDNSEFKKLSGLAKEQLGIKGKPFFVAIRAALTGTEHGADMELIFAVLTRKSILERLRRLI